jgi:hypothetical protein
MSLVCAIVYLPTVPNDVTAYQTELAESLREILPAVPVAVEWRAFPGLGFYSPRCDLAIGPFAVEDPMPEQYDRLVRRYRGLLGQILVAHTENVGAYDIRDGFDPNETMTVGRLSHRNWNPRCFVAVEIENGGSTKHLMGSAVNACALGRVGLAVGWTPKKVRQFVTVRRYLLELKHLDKLSFDTTNLLIVSSDQLRSIVAAELTRLREKPREMKAARKARVSRRARR